MSDIERSHDVCDDLLGKVITNIELLGEQDILVFTFDNGEIYRMCFKDVSEGNVYLQDIVGDTNNLLNKPLTLAEVVVSSKIGNVKNTNRKYGWAWTYYKLATSKGKVTFSWFGSFEDDIIRNVTFDRYSKVS